MKKLWGKWGTYTFHSNKIFIQLVVFTLVISIVPIIIISSIALERISHYVEDTLNITYSQFVAEYMSNMNATFFRYSDRLQQIAGNTIVIDELLNWGTSDNPYIRGEKVSIEIGKSLRSEGYDEFFNCMIYSNINESPIYGKKVSMLTEAAREPWYFNNRPIKEGNFSYVLSDGKSKVLSLIKEINYIDTRSFKNKYLGIVKLDLNATKLFEPIKKNAGGPYAYNIMVTDRDDQVIYSSSEKSLQYKKSIPFHKLSSNKMLIQDNVMIYGDRIEKQGLKVIFLFENNLLMQKQKEIQNTLIPMAILLIGVSSIMTYLFTRSFSKRVERLVNKIKSVEEGSLTITEEIKGKDEIAILDKQFNRMIKRVDSLIKKNYIQQLEKKEAELKNLQLQINPHFLYNTLETISSMAAVNHMFHICDLCEKLGDIFRYSLGKNYGEYVTIEQELTHTQNYVFIQKARFGNKFDVSYDIEPELMQYQILRFILQPIVENAIVHGLSTKKINGMLRIVIKREEDDVSIRIEDNGVGMTVEKRETLMAYINDSEINLNNRMNSIGVKNVNQRIKLACGENYGIIIQSELDQGSCFTIRLPWIQ